MGALNSCCIPRGEFEAITNSSTPKEKGHRRNLSATFNLSVIENTSTGCGLVNINTACEEELMTLPGVNRVIAKKIVDYRNHIGGFCRVEDLALVPGVGATRLAMMQGDVFVESLGKDNSCDGKQPSSPQVGTQPESPLALCVNSANIFSLLRVKGIGMTVAKNIVAHRDKYGKYTKLDDLLKVKGIDLYNLETMRPFLTVEDRSQKTQKMAEDAQNGNCMKDTAGNRTVKQEHFDKVNVHRSTSSLENLLQVLGPLAKVPQRPKVDKVAFKFKDRDIFRLASWNLEAFSLPKSCNPGVKDVVCMTILENGFGLVAVQELLDREALCEICKELNSPSLPNVRKWTGHRGQWACVVSETAVGRHLKGTYQGFLYDKSQNIELIRSSQLKGTPDTEKTCPFVGQFKIKQSLTLTAVNVHIKATDLTGGYEQETKSQIQDLIHAARREFSDNTTVILGELNQLPHAHLENYLQCIPVESASSNHGAACGNIWLSKEAQAVYTGVSGIVTDGLSSSWIPDGWLWGGLATSSCPVFSQIYSSQEAAGGMPHKATFY